MQAPERQRLVWLRPQAWASLRARKQAAAGAGAVSADAVELACIGHWAQHDLPLVVTRQPAADPAPLAGIGGEPPARERPEPAALALGLPAPARWERRRLALRVPIDGIARIGDFPPAASIAPLLPAAARADWLGLCAELAALGIVARVYGSHGWQHLTDLAYLHAGSDLDLSLALPARGQEDAADGAVARLAAAAAQPGLPLPRLDGELGFADGSAVAWREWAAWRSGRVSRLLVKRRDGATLESAASWSDAA